MMILPRVYFIVNVRYLIVGLKHILMCLEIVAPPNLARPQSFEESSQNFLIIGLIAVKRLSCLYRILLIHCANVQNATNNSLAFHFCLCYHFIKVFI